MRQEQILRLCHEECVKYADICENLDELENDEDGTASIDDIAQLRAERRAAWDRLVNARNEAYTVIANANLSPIYYRIMVSRYLRGMSWTQIIHKVKKSRRRVFQLHEEAMKIIEGEQKETEG